MRYKKPKVFFHPIEGSGTLSISWFSGPKGAAVEAKNEKDVGFFSGNGELLGVSFDDVAELSDVQALEFDCYRIEVKVKKGVVRHTTETRKKIRAA
jgi:hypothetical protein